MSWDAYNKARKEAKEAAEKAKKIATGKADKELSKSDKSKIKKAYSNAKTYKWCTAIFIIITILALVTLPFSDYFENKINSTFERDGVITAVTDARENSTLNINYINVLQGDCILINLPDGKNMIIDAGTVLDYHNKSDYPAASDENVVSKISNYLVDSGNPTIDYLIMTHPDYDHFSFMEAILENFEVTKMYRPNVYFGIDEEDMNTASAEDIALAEAEEQRANSVGAAYVTQDDYRNTLDQNGDRVYNGYNVKTESVASYGDTLIAMYNEAEENGGDSEVLFTFQLDTITNAGEPGVSEDEVYTFTFYAPIDAQHLYTDWNNYSAFIILEYKDVTYCFTGDTEAELEQQIIAQYRNELPDVDIMDAGHHGSSTSSSSALLDILKPEVVICSCDNGETYGHPADDTIQRFVDAGVAINCIFTTNNNGDICVALDYQSDETTNTDSENTTNTDSENTVNNNDLNSLLVNLNSANNNILNTSTDVSQVTEPEFSYVVGITTNGEVTVTDLRWWHIVVAIIVFAGIVFLIIVPSVLKSVKKKK